MFTFALYNFPHYDIKSVTAVLAKYSVLQNYVRGVQHKPRTIHTVEITHRSQIVKNGHQMTLKTEKLRPSEAPRAL